MIVTRADIEAELAEPRSSALATPPHGRSNTGILVDDLRVVARAQPVASSIQAR